MLTKSHRIGYSGLCYRSTQTTIIVTLKPPPLPLPKILTSHGGFRKYSLQSPTYFAREYLSHPGFELLMQDFVSWTGVWRLSLHPLRIPSHFIYNMQIVFRFLVPVLYHNCQPLTIKAGILFLSCGKKIFPFILNCNHNSYFLFFKLYNSSLSNVLYQK